MPAQSEQKCKISHFQYFNDHFCRFCDVLCGEATLLMLSMLYARWAMILLLCRWFLNYNVSKRFNSSLRFFMRCLICSVVGLEKVKQPVSVFRSLPLSIAIALLDFCNPFSVLYINMLYFV